MTLRFLCTLLLVSVAICVSAQSPKVVMVPKNKIRCDARVKKYMSTVAINRDTIVWRTIGDLRSQYTEVKELTSDEQTQFVPAVVKVKKVNKKLIDKKPLSNLKLIKFFQKENPKLKVYSPQYTPAQVLAISGGQKLVVLNRYRINNKGWLNKDFRNKTEFVLYYSVFNEKGEKTDDYVVKLSSCIKWGMKRETFLRYNRLLTESLLTHIAAK